MHIVDGVLTAPVLITGAVLAAGGVALGLRQLDAERIPQVALLSAAFFVASLIHLPLGPSSVHLILNGLMGILLGWATFPAILIALLLQAVFFGFGGLLVLGVSTCCMAAPAVLCGYLCRPYIRWGGTHRFMGGFIAGSLSVALTALLVSTVLSISSQTFELAAKLVIISHLPVMLIEGFVTGAAVTLMQQVKPTLLQSAHLAEPKSVSVSPP